MRIERIISGIRAIRWLMRTQESLSVLQSFLFMPDDRMHLKPHVTVNGYSLRAFPERTLE
jgi:hypothetical protein